jgi:catalase (peroxidase I)
MYLYDSRIAKQRIEFEREKLRKLKEVYQIAVDKTQNCRFFVRDFLEYIKKVMSMQLNVNKL